jgi:hypothetical protein
MIAASLAASSNSRTGIHFTFRFLNLGFEFRRKTHLIFNKIVQPITYLTQLGYRQLLKLVLKSLYFTHVEILFNGTKEIKPLRGVQILA